MATRESRRRRAPTFDPLERRRVSAVIGLAPAAVALYSSPLVSAVGTAATIYQAGQLAYTGHTTLLLGAVRVDQPYALKDLRGHRAGSPAWALPGVRLQTPPLLARLVHPAPH